MLSTRHADVLAPGLATGIGSLPHQDAQAATALTLRMHPRLPAVPQLPELDPREGLVAQWAGALPEITVARDGTLTYEAEHLGKAIVPVFDATHHAGLLAFLAAAEGDDTVVPRVKMQIVGPLTLGVALERAGMPTRLAFSRAGEAVRLWVRAVDELLAMRLPHSAPLLFLDEPALVLW